MKSNFEIAAFASSSTSNYVECRA